MRIAQLAPLYEAVPPRGYGGTELAVHQLTEALVARGHDVTLFASGDSETNARLVAPVPYALWSAEGRRRWPTADAAQAEEESHVQACFTRAREFDLVHNHAGLEGVLAAMGSSTPVLTTHHLAADAPYLAALASYPWAHQALSAAAAKTFPSRGQLAPIHHGIDVASYPFGARSEDYLLFLGRIVPEKGAEHAVEIARRAGRELRIAGVVQERAAEYGRRVLAQADGERIRYVGEAGPDAKRRLLRDAAALVFPITWDEPFGLVVIEAFACGTPVLAFGVGSAPELISPGETGFLAAPGADPSAPGQGADRLAQAVASLGRISRRRCREEAEERFTIRRMVDAYEHAYEIVISGSFRGSFVGSRAVVDDQLPGETRTVDIRE